MTCRAVWQEYLREDGRLDAGAELPRAGKNPLSPQSALMYFAAKPARLATAGHCSRKPFKANPRRKQRP